jgi:glycosyltransferase involved in cell wall biosynthesis
VKVGLDLSALDTSFKDHAHRGIGRYVKNLYQGLSAAKGDITITTFDQSNLKLPKVVDKLISLAPFGKGTIRQQICYPLYLNSKSFSHFDLLHFPAHMDAPSWSRKRVVVTVHDLIPLALKELYQTPDLNLRFHLARWLEKRGIISATRLITISAYSKRDIIKYLNFDEDRIDVIHLGIEESFLNAAVNKERDLEAEISVKIKYSIPLDRKVIVYFGGIDQRKNILTLIDSFYELLRNTEYSPVLLLIGKIEQEQSYNELLQAIAKRDLESDVKLLGFVSDEDLCHLLQIAAFTVFPSLYEGFGLPPLEAMAVGCPVVSSNTSSMPEVLGEYPIYFDPNKGSAELVDKMIVALQRNFSKEYLMAASLWARKYTWKKCAEETVHTYKRALGEINVSHPIKR